MRRAVLNHIAKMLLGYALAVLVSVAIALLIVGLQKSLPYNGNRGSLSKFWGVFPFFVLVGLCVTALYAFPGWLVSVTIAEFWKEQRRFWFAAAGALTAFIALLALSLVGKESGPLSMPGMFFGSIIGGFFGGLAYWAVAGRSSGQCCSLAALSIQSDPVGERVLK
jgi:cytochrome bd-type quinol oxidase subunit 2